MPRIDEPLLIKCLHAIMIENAMLAAEFGPVIMPPSMEVDELGQHYEQALDEINQHRMNAKRGKIEPPPEFKQKTIDALLRRMEEQGRVRYFG